MSSAVCRSTDQFLKAYDLPLDPERDFELDGQTAHFASGHPKEWGRETDSFVIDQKSSEGDFSYRSTHSDVSGDLKLLAISLSEGRVLVYDIESKELRQELEGTGIVRFRPLLTDGSSADESAESYTLVSSVSYDADRRRGPRDTLVLWELDKNGRLLVEEERLDTSAFATKAVASIIPELETKHEFTKEFIDASKLHDDFEKALSKMAAEHRRRHNTTIEDACLGSFRHEPFSADGKKLLYHLKDETTQQRMREPNELPHVGVWDIDAGRELLRLGGHTDAIMWSGFSPDGQSIASVSWDGTMRMYDANTGQTRWATENCGSQCWAGAFSPDSKHIAWSLKSGNTVQVHEVATGTIISTFQQDFKDWCRYLVWHPDSEQIALCVDRRAFVWRPFDGRNGKTTQAFQLKEDHEWQGFLDVSGIEWLQQGRKIAIWITDGSSLVWDSQTNAKELFKRTRSDENIAWTDRGFYYMHDEKRDLDFYISVDGDGKVRYWRTSVPAHPSWWDRSSDNSKTTDIKAEGEKKKVWPETGKYVKIVRTAAPKEKKDEKKGGKASRDTWAEKGAEIWTAE